MRLLKRIGLIVGFIVCGITVLFVAVYKLSKSVLPKGYSQVNALSRTKDLQEYFISKPDLLGTLGLSDYQVKDVFFDYRYNIVNPYQKEILSFYQNHVYVRDFEYQDKYDMPIHELIPELDAELSSIRVIHRERDKAWLQFSTEDTHAVEEGEYILEVFFEESGPRFMIHNLDSFTAAAIDSDNRIAFIFIYDKDYYEEYDLETKQYLSRRNVVDLENHYILSAIYDKYQKIIIVHDNKGIHCLENNQLRPIYSGEASYNKVTPKGIFYLRRGKIWHYDYTTQKNTLFFTPTRIPFAMSENAGYLYLSYDNSMLIYCYYYEQLGKKYDGLFVVDFKQDEYQIKQREIDYIKRIKEHFDVVIVE